MIRICEKHEVQKLVFLFVFRIGRMMRKRKNRYPLFSEMEGKWLTCRIYPHIIYTNKEEDMGLNGKKIVSKASGLTGRISGIEKNSLKITFTGFQDVTIPLNRAEQLLQMDDDVLEELRKEIRSRHISSHTPKESKVETYMDNFEEEVEEIEEQAPVQMQFDDVE